MSCIAFLGYIFALSSYWYLFLLGGFSKKHKFHGVGTPLGAFLEKNNNLQNQECHFLKMALNFVLMLQN